jgi:hypothetical protein
MARLACVTLMAIACSSPVMPGHDAGSFGPGATPIDLSQWSDAGLDADGLAYLTQISKAQHGQSADLDGDGYNELTVTHLPDGTTKWVSLPPSRGVPDFIVTAFPDGRRKYEANYENGAFFVLVVERSADQSTVTTSFDDNHDHVLERRTVQTPYDAGLELVVEQTSNTGMDPWTETQRYVVPEVRDQGAGACSGTSNMPGQGIAFTDATPGITLMPDGTAAGCSLQRSAKAGRALDCARKRVRDCLSSVNRPLSNLVMAHMASDGWIIGCNNPCSGKDASTRPPATSFFGSTEALTNFSSSLLDSADDNTLCAIVLHEMLHESDAPMDSSHEQGVDNIYACGRYCGFCIMRGPAHPSSNQDCAVCSDSDSARAKCGVTTTIGSVTCPAMDLCHGGVGVNLNCTACEGPMSVDCAGKPLPPPNGLCCMTCPANAPSNDKPCPGPVMPSDTCNMKPPMCP